MRKKLGETNEKHRLLIRQVEHLYVNAPIGFAASMINAFILAVIQWNVIDRKVILVWFASLALTTGLRYYFYQRFKISVLDEHNINQRKNVFIAGIAISGIIWGAGGVLLFSGEAVAHQLILALVLGGMVSGAASAFSAVLFAFAAFSLPALLPIIVKFLSLPGEVHKAMGLMSILFGVLTFMAAVNMHKTMKKAFRLQFENADLVQYLSRAKKQADKVNQELETEIQERKKAEAELTEHQKTLEKKVLDRTRELKDINEKLKAKIEDKERIERALRESEKKYRLLINHAEDAVLITNQGYIEFTNPAAERIFGYSAEELRSIPLKYLIHPDDCETVKKRSFSGAGSAESPKIYSLRMLHKSGKEVWADIASASIYRKGMPAELNFIRDITEKKRLESKTDLVQRMESVGTLVGGIANDFNNLLMGILGYVSLLKYDLIHDQKLMDRLNNIEEYAQSGARLTKQLSGMAGAGKHRIQPVDVNEIIEKTSELFARTKKQIRIIKNLKNEIGYINADRRQIEQALMDIYAGIAERKNENAEISLNTEVVSLPPEQAEMYDVDPGRFVVISIDHKDHGLSEQNIENFLGTPGTLKQKAKTAGLGLASIYGIIRNHKGFIKIMHGEKQCEAFYIYLPLIDYSDDLMQEEKKRIQPGAGTVMIIDDEEMIINVVGNMLHKLGFKTIGAQSGKEAIRILSEKKDQIDLVILDVIMPDMDGKQTWLNLKKIDPDIKILITSGLHSEEKQLDDSLMKNESFIQKPFTIEQLSEKLNMKLEFFPQA